MAPDRRMFRGMAEIGLEVVKTRSRFVARVLREGRRLHRFTRTCRGAVDFTERARHLLGVPLFDIQIALGL